MNNIDKEIDKLNYRYLGILSFYLRILSFYNKKTIRKPLPYFRKLVNELNDFFIIRNLNTINIKSNSYLIYDFIINLIDKNNITMKRIMTTLQEDICDYNSLYEDNKYQKVIDIIIEHDKFINHLYDLDDSIFYNKIKGEITQVINITNLINLCNIYNDIKDELYNNKDSFYITPDNLDNSVRIYHDKLVKIVEKLEEK